jgi:two-component sensor histidine kinase
MSLLNTIEPNKTEIEYGRRLVSRPAEPLILSGQEAEHRIVTHLALLSDYLRLEAAHVAERQVEPTVDSVQQLLEDIRSKVTVLAQLQRSLAGEGVSESASLRERLLGICAGLTSLYDGRIVLVQDVSDGCWVAPHQIALLTRIVAEAINNAARHAYPMDEVGTVIIRGRADEAGAVVVEIIDGGPGLPYDFDVLSDAGLGFWLMRALARQLGASIEYRSGRPGLRVRLTLPPESDLGAGRHRGGDRNDAIRARA